MRPDERQAALIAPMRRRTTTTMSDFSNPGTMAFARRVAGMPRAIPCRKNIARPASTA